MSFASSPSGSFSSASTPPPQWSHWGVFDVEEPLVLDGGHMSYTLEPGTLMLARYSVASPLVVVQGVPIQDSDWANEDHVNSVLHFLERTDIAAAELVVDGVVPVPLHRLLAAVNDVYVAHGQSVPYPGISSSSIHDDPTPQRTSFATHIRRASLMLSSFADLLTCGCLASSPYSKPAPADYSDEWIIVPDPKRLSTSDASSLSESLLYPPTPSMRRSYGSIQASIVLPPPSPGEPAEQVLSPRDEKLPKLRVKHHRNSSSTSSLPIAPVSRTRSKIRPKAKTANSLRSVTDECEPLLA